MARNTATRTRKHARKGWRTAKGSDRHELYELSVQDPSAEIAFIDRRYRELHGRAPKVLREDFCGTGFLSCEWVKHRSGNEAWGIDLCTGTMAWGKARHGVRLTAAQRARMHWVKGDVRGGGAPAADVIAALNFSYFIFKSRTALVEYFRAAFANMKPGGLFVLDSYGGFQSFSVTKEERDLDGFTYVWHTERYNPINGDVLNHIHFRFPDGTELRKAFTYDWRLWTLAEIQEALVDAGFVRPAAYWEGTTEDGEGDGKFRRTAVGEACEGWIAYITAQRPRR
ncbi:MAG: class I SAM-dependent methyltransferase [Planctomycetes bacterium]|nr:class I SAM-dependent methyltransferase [Planctomycetota bacterium]